MKNTLYIISLSILLIFILAGCNNNNSTSSNDSDTSSDNIENSRDTEKDDGLSNSTETTNFSIDDVKGLWFNEEYGPIDIQFFDDNTGKIVYINGVENLSYTFENIKVEDDSIVLTITGSNLENVNPYDMEFTQLEDERISVYDHAFQYTVPYNRMTEEYVLTNYDYVSAVTENTSDEEYDSSDVVITDEEYDVTVVQEVTGSLEVSKDGNPDIVVYETPSLNLLGREILESFFQKEGLTYYYQDGLDRVIAIRNIYREPEEREFRLDIMMDWKIPLEEMEEKYSLENQQHVLLTHPFDQSGDYDSGYFWYFAFALPPEHQELHEKLNAHIKNMLTDGSLQSATAKYNSSSSTILLPESMDIEDFFGN
ncbi:hypothetical protein DHX103_07495 [Planococcus sp. X10-3]|uniref:hypothetical protein n=1 Tax=Planococcus sp. X10-3 TaxID=3061240 RepID=UPI003BB0BF41